MAKPTVVGLDSGVICLTPMTQYLRQPTDPDAIRHDLGRAERVADRADIVRAPKRLKLKARIAKVFAQAAGPAASAEWPKLPAKAYLPFKAHQNPLRAVRQPMRWPSTWSAVLSRT